MVAVRVVGLGAEHRAENSAGAAVQAAQERAFLGNRALTTRHRKHLGASEPLAFIGGKHALSVLALHIARSGLAFDGIGSVILGGDALAPSGRRIFLLRGLILAVGFGFLG